MTKTEALKIIVESKATSPSTRNFVTWLYKNGYQIIKEEPETKDGWANWGIVGQIQEND